MTEAKKPVGRWALLAALFAVGAAIAVWLVVSAQGPSRSPTTPRQDADEAAQVALLEEVPERLRARPDRVDGDVQLAADALSDDPAEIAVAIRKAVKAGHIPIRDVVGDAPGAPHLAGVLAPALRGQTVPAAAPFELAILAGAILRARKVEDLQYGWVPGARFSATELLARRYVLRVGDGLWVAFDDAPVVQSDVRPLEPLGFAANILAWRALGAMPEGRADDATQAANVARRLAPDDPAILFVVGRAQIVGGTPDAGVATMERAAAIEADALTWYVMARIARLDGRPFRADQFIQKAIAADPKFVDPHLLLAELALDRIEVTAEADQPAVLAQAREALAAARAIDADAEGLGILEAQLADMSGDRAAAEGALRAEIARHPTLEDGWLLLAQLQAANDAQADAIATLTEAANKGVATADVLKALGALLANNGRFAEALTAMEKALAARPEDPELRPQIAQLYRYQGRVGDARELLETQLKRFPDDRIAPLLLAQLELEERNFDRAILLIDAVALEAPDNQEAALLAYVARLAAEQDTAKARARALEVVGSYRAVAQALLEQGLAQEAEKILVEGLTEDPEDPVIAVFLVGLWHRAGRIEDAKALRAKTVAPFEGDDLTALQNLFDEAIAQATEGGETPDPEQDAPEQDTPAPPPEDAPTPTEDAPAPPDEPAPTP